MEETFLQHALPVDNTGRQAWHTFLAAEIPYVTDVLSTFKEGEGPTRRDDILNDALQLQVAFLKSLGQVRQDGRALEFRYLFDPATQRIRLVLLAKVVAADRERSLSHARNLWQHISSAFPSLYGTPELMKLWVPNAATDLTRVLQFPDRPGAQPAALYLAEFRRAEALEHLMGDIHGYVVYPIQGTPLALSRLFAFLHRQSQPYVISVCLTPTTLYEEESIQLGQIANYCRELGKQTTALLGGGTQETVNIPASNVADLYSHYLRQLREPFLLRVSIASPAPINPGLFADIAGDLAHPYRLDTTGREQRNRPGRFITPQNQGEYRYAWHNFRFLECLPWGPTEAQDALRRLPTLVDAESAVAIWRIPLPPLGGLPGMDSRPVSQFALPPGPLQHPPAGSTFIDLNQVKPQLDDLTRHILVAGTIGSGKTNTCIQILHQIWSQHRVPFLVIEPVNAEHNDYRSLGHLFPVPSELRVFTIGDEGTSPLRFNPLAVPAGTILNAHISGVMHCFKAALPLEGVMPILLERAIRAAYFGKGWSGETRGTESDIRPTPTLEDVIAALEPLIAELYTGEVRRNLEGALTNRIRSLTTGSAGQTVLAERSVPLAEIFEHPTILELRHLGNDEDKALLIGFIMLALQEYSDKNRKVGTGKLQHIVMLEEAHTLLSEPRQAPGGQGGSKAGAVEFFTKMLAENRKYGQGFVIAEQIPTLLAEGAVKNTVTKIMHRLPGRDDIQTMGGAMNFADRHQVRAGTLQARAGEAFFFTEGMNEATLINVKYFDKSKPLNDEEVRERMAHFQRQLPDVYRLPFAGCALCTAQCDYRTRVQWVLSSPQVGQTVLKEYQKANTKDRFDLVSKLATPIRTEIKRRGFRQEELLGATYCAFLHLHAKESRLAWISEKALAGFKKTLDKLEFAD